jgi:glycosyltransferase involved in cell wall biosynthesis
VFHRACCELSRAGYEVHLIAAGEKKEAYQEKGVTIHPLPECKSRWQRFTRASYVARVAADLKPDLFHVHEPGLLSSVLAKAGSRPVIYDVHETYLDILKSSDWIPRWTRPLAALAWDQWERQLVRRCAGIIVTTRQQSLRYEALHSRVRIIANYPHGQSVEDLPPVKRDGITCVFAGVLRPDRGISQMLRAVALLKERGLVVRLALAGTPLSDEYLSSLHAEAKRLGIEKLMRYHGVLSNREAFIFQHQGSIGLIADLPYRYFLTVVPTKLMECMSLGLPVVCSDLPVYREVAGATGAGIMVDPTKPEKIADAIERLVLNPDLARQMGEAGRRAVRERFNWNIERVKLLQLYDELMGAPYGDRRLQVTAV